METKIAFPTSIDSLPSSDGPTDFDVLSRGLSKYATNHGNIAIFSPFKGSTFGGQ